jgi:hypothetical protein
LRHSCRWFGCQLGEGLVKFRNCVAVLKDVGYKNHIRNLPCRVFRRRAILKASTARRYCSFGCDSSPVCFASCLATKGGSTSTWMVSFKRSPFLGAAHRSPSIPTQRPPNLQARRDHLPTRGLQRQRGESVLNENPNL